MNNTHVNAKANELKGKVKEEVGHLSGNEAMASEGVADQIKGKIQHGIADLKDGVKAAVDRVLNKDKH